MTDSRAEVVERRLGALAADRSTWEPHWEELARLCQPFRDEITGTRAAGSKRGHDLYDGTAGYAANNLASGLWGMVTNSANQWFHIRPELDELAEQQDVKLWCDLVTRRMQSAFHAHGGRFYAQALPYYLDLLTFGTAVMYQDEDAARGALWFSTRHLAECFVAQDAREAIDTVYRRFRLSARQAAQMFGEEALHPKVRKMLKDEPDRRITFAHAVEPNPDFDPRRADARGKPVQSLYVDMENRHVCKAGGYHEFPYHVCRWAQASGHAYGESPAMLARPDAKMLQVMSKTTITAAQKVVDPALLATDEFSARGVRTSPGSIIYGGLDPLTGKPALQPLQTGANIGLGLEMEEQRRTQVREAFHWSLLIMVATDRATATEVLTRQEEKLRLMGPHLGRIQHEFLNTAIDRAFGLMYRAGAFPPPPPVLQQYPGLKVDYISPLARAQRVAEATSTLRWIEGLGAVAQLDPQVLDNVDADEAARTLADAYGVPARLVKDKRLVEQLRQARAEQQQQQAMLEAAPPLAQAARDAAQAGATAAAGSRAP